MSTFLGYQGPIISYVSDSREKIENIPNVIITKIEETDFPVELVNGAYYVGENSIMEAKQDYVREVRNTYLEIYVDPIVSNPLRWADMTEREQQRYINYRIYLLDYTKRENWWEQEPLTFEEWV